MFQSKSSDFSNKKGSSTEEKGLFFKEMRNSIGIERIKGFEPDKSNQDENEKKDTKKNREIKRTNDGEPNVDGKKKVTKKNQEKKEPNEVEQHEVLVQNSDRKINFFNILPREVVCVSLLPFLELVDIIKISYLSKEIKRYFYECFLLWKVLLENNDQLEMENIKKNEDYQIYYKKMNSLPRWPSVRTQNVAKSWYYEIDEKNDRILRRMRFDEKSTDSVSCRKYNIFFFPNGFRFKNGRHRKWRINVNFNDLRGKWAWKDYKLVFGIQKSKVHPNDPKNRKPHVRDDFGMGMRSWAIEFSFNHPDDDSRKKEKLLYDINPIQTYLGKFFYYTRFLQDELKRNSNIIFSFHLDLMRSSLLISINNETVIDFYLGDCKNNQSENFFFGVYFDYGINLKIVS